MKMSRVSLWVIVLLAAVSLHGGVIKPFEVRYQSNINGKVVMTGNTLMSVGEQMFVNDEPPLDLKNDHVDMRYVDMDNDPETVSSSSSFLDIKKDSEVLFAGLYWGARNWGLTSNEIKFKIPDGEYISLDPDWHEKTDRGSYYAAFKDVTELVREGGRGDYWAADIVANQGEDKFAGWSLVVVEKNSDYPFRNITVFDGYAMVPPSVTILAQGFKAPLQGAFSASMGVVVFEGDINSVGDQLLLNGQPLSDQVNSENDFFNSRFTKDGEHFYHRSPDFTNLMGFDIKEIDVTGYVGNGDEEATLAFTTTRDYYQPAVLTFMTDFNTDIDVRLTKAHEGDLAPGSVVSVYSAVKNSGKIGYAETTAHIAPT